MTIHTKGIRGSGMIKEGESSEVMLGAIVEIDGTLVDRVTRVRVLHDNDNVTYVTVNFVPGELDTIAHTQDSWSELIARIPS